MDLRNAGRQAGAVSSSRGQLNTGVKRYNLKTTPVICCSNNSGDIQVCSGQENIARYLASISSQVSAHEVVFFNPPGSQLTLRLYGKTYVLKEVGAIVTNVSEGIAINHEPFDSRADGIDPIAIVAAAPQWWRPCREMPINTSGYCGDDSVGVYRLSERREPHTSAPTTWITDSVSSKPKRVSGVLGVSYVVPKGPKPCGQRRMISIVENRPEENVHRHPQVSRYEPEENMPGLNELYVSLQGKLGIAMLDSRQATLTCHLLGESEALCVEPEEIHAVVSTSPAFQYLCIQLPSCYHYPHYYNKHQFFNISEASVAIGYDLAELIAIEEPGTYLLEVDAVQSSALRARFV